MTAPLNGGSLRTCDLRPCSYPEENKRKQKAAALLVDLAVLL